MQSAHFAGLMRIGFFTGRAIMRMQFGDLQPVHDFRQCHRFRARSAVPGLTVRMNVPSAEEAIATEAVLSTSGH